MTYSIHIYYVDLKENNTIILSKNLKYVYKYYEILIKFSSTEQRPLTSTTYLHYNIDMNII